VYGGCDDYYVRNERLELGSFKYAICDGGQPFSMDVFRPVVR